MRYDDRRLMGTDAHNAPGLLPLNPHSLLFLLLARIHGSSDLLMSDPVRATQTMHPAQQSGAGLASVGTNGSTSSEDGSREGEDRREAHEAALAGENRAQETKCAACEAAHRPLRRPSPSPDRQQAPVALHARSLSHHPILPTSTISPSHLPAHDSLLPSPPRLPPAHLMPPDALLPLLYCPLCAPPALLRAPVTLHCGHTFCASHFTLLTASSSSKSSAQVPLLPQCPLPTCSASSRSAPTVLHAPPVDVTTNKLIDLLANASREDLSPPPTFHDDPDDRTDSEYEVDPDSDLEYLPLPPQSPSGSGSHLSSPHSRDSNHTSAPLTPRQRSRSPSGSSPQLHPRKRRRRHRPRVTPPRTRSDAQRTDHDPHARVQKELLSELTCEICFGLFWQPITTPCQHTFCTRCLFRSLDHSQTCPLCRQQLPGYDYFQQQPCNKAILAIILKAFPDAYAERGAMVEAEERDTRLDTPVFVCQLSFPGMPTLLHLFEPRYRLMLRRCLQSQNPCFGMIPPPRAPPSTSDNGSTSTGNDYGTMLQIRNVHTLPDGRSLVETWGTWRFRIMERGIRDGYTVARVERIEDYEEELDASAHDEPNPTADASLDANSELDARSNPPEAEEQPRAGSSRTWAVDRRAAAEPGEQLAVAARAAIDDVFDHIEPEAPPVASTSAPAPTPSSSRSLASSSTILPAPPSALPNHRGAVRSQAAGSVVDAQASPAPRRPPTNADLIAKCHAFIEQTRQGTPWVVQHLHNHYVPMPSDPASFSFWMALLLPIDEHEKAKLLPIRSPRLRLRLVVHWIEQLTNQWANAYASASALQVVLWRVRYFMMLPRAVGIWAMLLAYSALLAAIFFGQAVADRDFRPRVGSGFRGGEL
ncbi:hypothetical protein C8Q74DRAFT_1368804 [Fomes fomentarius]|nr:hypothetical protein C8Q74DRAFT_1368804 [Fomes fomentarius]